MYYTFYVLRSFMHVNDNSTTNHMNFKSLYSLSLTSEWWHLKQVPSSLCILVLLLKNGDANSTYLMGLEGLFCSVLHPQCLQYKSSRHTYCKTGETEWGKLIAPRFCYLPLTLEKALAPTLSCPAGKTPGTPSPEGRLLLTKLDSLQSFCGTGATSDSALFHKHASQGAEKLLRTSMKPSAQGNATVTHMDWIFCSFSDF